MTILLKILGFSWLVLSAAVYLILYGFIWIVEGHHAVVSYFLSGGALGSIGLGVMAMPGVALVALPRRPTRLGIGTQQVAQVDHQLPTSRPAKAGCSFAPHLNQGLSGNVSLIPKMGKRAPASGAKSREKKAQARERCPPKAEVVSSNLAGSANRVQNREHLERWHSRR
jgi:hypothetical protein